MFYEDLNTGGFIRPSRVLSGGPLISSDYLVDRVFAEIRNLDVSILSHPGADLYATAMDVDACEPVALSGFSDEVRALEMLRATARMPLLSGGLVTLDGHRLLDGGLLARVPFGLAMQMGAMHVLAILTQRVGDRQLARAPLGDRMFGYPILSIRHSSRLADRMRSERYSYEQFYA